MKPTVSVLRVLGFLMFVPLLLIGFDPRYGADAQWWNRK